MAKKKKGEHRTPEQQLAETLDKAARLRKTIRADDTRRKILIGSLVQQQTANDPEAQQRLDEQLAEWLIEDRDRRVFRMPLLTDAEKKTRREQAKEAEATDDAEGTDDDAEAEGGRIKQMLDQKHHRS